MVSFAQVTANPGLVQDRKILELYDKRGNCKALSSHKDIVGQGKDKEGGDGHHENYYDKLIEFLLHAGPHHSFMYVNNNNVDLPLIGPILPHSDPWCPI